MSSVIKDEEKNNESSYYSSNKDNKKNKTMKKIVSTSQLHKSLEEFDLLDLLTKRCKKSKNKSPKKSNSYLHYSNGKEYLNQITPVQSPFEYRYLQKKIVKSIKNLKRCSSQKKFETFLDRVKRSQIMKDFHINNIRNKILESETKEMSSRPEINKISIILLKNNNRKPLYQQGPLNEDKKLEKKFQKFYEQSLKDSQSNTFTPRNNQISGKNFNKFYDEEMKWKNYIAQKNSDRKLNEEQIIKEYLDTFRFKPSLNQNSINIINKLAEKNISEKKRNDIFFESGNDRESIEKFKLKIKPLMTNIYSENIYKIYINKKNHGLKRTLSEININHVNNFNIDNNNNDNNNLKKNKNQTNKNKIKINYKINEKKYCKLEAKNKIKKEGIKQQEYKTPRDYYIWSKLKGINNKNILDKELEDLYKVNIRPGTSWNYDVINKVTAIKKSDQFLDNIYGS